jgi:hypothetical protein
MKNVLREQVEAEIWAEIGSENQLEMSEFGDEFNLGATATELVTKKLR